MTAILWIGGLGLFLIVVALTAAAHDDMADNTDDVKSFQDRYK